MKKLSLKITALLLCLASLFGNIAICPTADEPKKYCITEADALVTSGEKIVNKKGEQIFLRGINLGGWLIQEDWFCPINSLYNEKKGNLNTIRILTERFGTEKAYELFDIYYDNFITETDFYNISKMGFNCVRIPFWYRNFQSDDNGTWILDESGKIDLSRLEWAVEMCRKYGIYAILDLHAANGVQGRTDHAGLTKSYHFFDRNDKGEWYRKQAVELWAVIAERFKGDPAVAMFDLLNEPMCDTFLHERIHQHYWDFYVMAYNRIRSIDPDRMISMIGTWSAAMLPNPKKYGWTNVVYQYHQYDKTLKHYTDRIEEGYRCKYNVPQYAGEFHPKNGTATLDQAIGAYDSNNVIWTLWTYKGYNSWAAWSDWFIYGAWKDTYVVDPVNDSYETIAFKWGEVMQTNSKTFSIARLYDVAKKYLPVEPLEKAPKLTSEDVAAYVPGDLVKGFNHEHTPIEIPEKLPTCSETGFSAGKRCKDCYLILEGQTILPKTQHIAGEWEVKIPAEINKKGTQVKNCIYCKIELESKDIPALPVPTTEPTTQTTTVPPTTVPHTTVPPTTVPPTTVPPTTVPPTTVPPTTVPPTTVPPTTKQPSTTKPPQTTVPPTTKPSYILGDVNGDGAVKANDARIALRAAAKLEVLSEAALKAADLNQDNKVSASEARAILRFAAKLSDKLR